MCVTYTYPESTPSTRLSIKKDPMMMRGMKYNQFQAFPEASLLCRRETERERILNPGKLKSGNHEHTQQV